MREGFDSVIVTIERCLTISHTRGVKEVRPSDRTFLDLEWSNRRKRGNNTENYKDIKCVYFNYSSMDG
jgi:hypothetical protein